MQSFFRCGNRTFQGILKDGWNAMARYYLNNFADGTKQVCETSVITAYLNVMHTFFSLQLILACSPWLRIKSSKKNSHYAFATFLFVIFPELDYIFWSKIWTCVVLSGTWKVKFLQVTCILRCAWMFITGVWPRWLEIFLISFFVHS